MSDYLSFAKLLGSHGLHGELRVDPYNPDSPFWEEGETLFLKQGESYLPRRILALREGKQGFLVVLEGIATREEAKALYGAELFVARDSLPALEDDYTQYVNDVIGLTVVDAQNGTIYGTVADLFSGAGQDCLVVKRPEGRELLIPALRPIIARYAMDEGRVYVDLPEGLLEL